MDSKSPSSTSPATPLPDSSVIERSESDVTGQCIDSSIKTTGTLHMAAGQVKMVDLMGVSIVSLFMDGQERLCLAQISSTLLRQYSYNEIHNRRVALGITCVQCTPVQLEILRRAGAMPVSSRRCGMITKREAERLCKSFLTDNAPPKLPDNFSFEVQHRCAWGCRGKFVPSRYNSSRAKCVQCVHCRMFFSPNKFIFHSHRFADSTYTQPDAANFNSWRRHLHLTVDPERSDHVTHAWEDVKAMFNGGTRKRFMTAALAAAPPRSVAAAPKKMHDASSTHSVSAKLVTSSSSTSMAHSSPRKSQHSSIPTTGSTTFRRSGASGSAGLHSPLYCNPLHFPHQFSQQQQQQQTNDMPQSVGWLCGPPHPLNPYAALAAAAAAAAAVQHQQQQAPFGGGAAGVGPPTPCWFPYPPFLPQAPFNSMNSLITPVVPNQQTPSLISPPPVLTSLVDVPNILPAASNEEANSASGGAEDSKIPESAFTSVSVQKQQSKEDEESSLGRMTKEKLRELLMSEIRTRQQLESDLMQLKGDPRSQQQLASPEPLP